MKTILTTQLGKTALDGSIHKWKNIVLRLESNLPPLEKGISDCPLCALFHPYLIRLRSHEDVNDRDCVGCPIRIDTDAPFCSKTPYIAWSAEEQSTGRNIDNAKAMRDYLIALDARTSIAATRTKPSTFQQ